MGMPWIFQYRVLSVAVVWMMTTDLLHPLPGIHIYIGTPHFHPFRIYAPIQTKNSVFTQQTIYMGPDSQPVDHVLSTYPVRTVCVCVSVYICEVAHGPERFV